MRNDNSVKVSVVIPTKNAGPILNEVLKSVMRQEAPWSYEVIVIDSGSKDGTVQLVKSFSEVKLIEINPKDFGHGKTRNFAIENSSGQYIAMITQDALPVHTTWLRNLVEVIEQDDHIAGVFGRHIAYENASPFTQNELEAHFSGFLKEPIVSLKDQIRYGHDDGYRQYLYFFSDNNALLRKTVWEKIQYPEIDFAEDQAWAKLVIEAGYLKAYAHDAPVFHSHDYGFIERLQRSFDESYALKTLFSYRQSFGLNDLVKSWVGLTVRDLKLVLKRKSIKKDFRHLMRMPIDNLMRLVGMYVGSKWNNIPSFIRVGLSRDKRLFAE